MTEYRSGFEAPWRRELRRATGDWTHVFEGRRYHAFCGAAQTPVSLTVRTDAFSSSPPVAYRRWVASVDIVRLADGNLEDAYLTTALVDERSRPLGPFEVEILGACWHERRIADLRGLYDAVFGRLHELCVENGHAFDTVPAPEILVGTEEGCGRLLIDERRLVERGIVLEASGQRWLAVGR